MKAPRGISGQRAIRAFKRAGWEAVNQKGSHVHLENEEKPGVILTIPVHGKPLKVKALLKQIENAGLTVEEFRDYYGGRRATKTRSIFFGLILSAVVLLPRVSCGECVWRWDCTYTPCVQRMYCDDVLDLPAIRPPALDRPSPRPLQNLTRKVLTRG